MDKALALAGYGYSLIIIMTAGELLSPQSDGLVPADW
jgi:hypothetical protein